MTDAPISRAIALAAASAARDKQAADVVVLDVAELLSITDYFVICSASSNRQLKTVIEAVEERVRDLGASGVETVIHYECSDCYRGTQRMYTFTHIG